MSRKPVVKDRLSLAARPVREPVMKVNNFDRLSALMISIVVGLLVAVAVIFLWWLTTRPPHTEFLVPLEMVQTSGGSETGAEEETLQVESPEDPAENASLTEDPIETETSDVMDNIVELAEQASQLAQQTLSEANSTGGQPGSSIGTGQRALGSGGGEGEGGIPAEQRWFIRYADESSLKEYARQLDFFGLELGALLPDGQLVYIRQVSQPNPEKRVVTSGKDEKRLYMTWQQGGRKDADVKLFARAGVDASRSVIFHFYPKATEQLLLRKEYDYAQRKASEILRTYFVVTSSGKGFDFVVSRQTYIK